MFHGISDRCGDLRDARGGLQSGALPDFGRDRCAVHQARWDEYCGAYDGAGGMSGCLLVEFADYCGAMLCIECVLRNGVMHHEWGCRGEMSGSWSGCECVADSLS